MGYTPTNASHADFPSVYTNDKVLNLSTIDKIHLKCDIINGSVVNGLRELIQLSFDLDRPSGYKVFHQPETVSFKKFNKSVRSALTFSLEDDKHKELNFNGETLTFTLQRIKI